MNVLPVWSAVVFWKVGFFCRHLNLSNTVWANFFDTDRLSKCINSRPRKNLTKTLIFNDELLMVNGELFYLWVTIIMSSQFTVNHSQLNRYILEVHHFALCLSNTVGENVFIIRLSRVSAFVFTKTLFHVVSKIWSCSCLL